MKIINILLWLSNLSVLSLLLIGCDDKIEYDPCLETKWLNPMEYEIKLAVTVSENNPSLPGGTEGSRYPVDFCKMQVSGTIEKFECDGESIGPFSLGNTYLENDYDHRVILFEKDCYWIGHVVYVFEFDNDEDYIDIDLDVKITMEDEQSYSCVVSDIFYSDGIKRVPGELYYHILIDINSNKWQKE
jgi:hypothetical protein